MIITACAIVRLLWSFVRHQGPLVRSPWPLVRFPIASCALPLARRTLSDYGRHVTSINMLTAATNITSVVQLLTSEGGPPVLAANVIVA